MAFRPAALHFHRGTWVIHFVNQGSLFHDLTIEPANRSKVLDATGAQPGQSSDLSVTLGPGHYVMICLEPGHAPAGMVGAIDVT